MKICVLSDLHGYLPKLNPCDFVFICGDVVPLKIQRNMPQCASWFRTTFAEWINSLPCKEVYLVAGNHDFYLERIHNDAMAIHQHLIEPTNNKLHYVHEEIVFDITDFETGNSYTLWGAPYCHQFGRWAFMPKPETQLEKFQMMPEDCDFVICHDPTTFNNLGLVPPNAWHNEPVNAGNEELTKVILERSPKYFFCGHIHEGNHNLTDYEGIKCANVSILDDSYTVVYKPLYLEI